MTIESRTSIGTTQKVLPKHEVGRVPHDGRSRQDGKHARREQQGRSSESPAVSTEQGQLTGKLIDITV